jgi:hypothetical protein
MSLSLIRTKIKTKLEAISGVENVYDYKRYSADLATYKDLFINDSRVNTWDVERKTFSKISHGGHGDVEDSSDDFVIRGFYSVYEKLTSEKTFQDLVETICADFLNDPTLGGTATLLRIPITGEFSTVMLGNVLCHQVQINISIIDRTI